MPGLDREVEAGNLSPGTRRLVRETLDADAGLRRAAAATTREWDGTIVVREPNGPLALVREHVVPVEATGFETDGLHLSFWLPVGRDTGSSTTSGETEGAIGALLTPRQHDIARLFASGLTAHEVAATAGISWRTARAHLEEIYGRLGVHSRAELALTLARVGLI